MYRGQESLNLTHNICIFFYAIYTYVHMRVDSTNHMSAVSFVKDPSLQMTYYKYRISTRLHSYFSHKLLNLARVLWGSLVGIWKSLEIGIEINLNWNIIFLMIHLVEGGSMIHWKWMRDTPIIRWWWADGNAIGVTRC